MSTRTQSGMGRRTDFDFEPNVTRIASEAAFRLGGPGGRTKQNGLCVITDINIASPSHGTLRRIKFCSQDDSPRSAPNLRSFKILRGRDLIFAVHSSRPRTGRGCRAGCASYVCAARTRLPAAELEDARPPRQRRHAFYQREPVRLFGRHDVGAGFPRHHTDGRRISDAAID